MVASDLLDQETEDCSLLSAPRHRRRCTVGCHRGEERATAREGARVESSAGHHWPPHHCSINTLQYLYCPPTMYKLF